MTPQEAIASIPKRIKVGSFVYRVEFVEQIDDDGSDAQIFPDELLIKVRRSSPDPAYVSGSIIHELLHAIWDERNIPDGADEETIVSNLERGLSCLIQDNPRLITYLKKCLLAGKKL